MDDDQLVNDILSKANSPGELLNALNKLSPEELAVFQKYCKVSRNAGIAIYMMNLVDIGLESLTGTPSTEDYVNLGIATIGTVGGSYGVIASILITTYKDGFMYFSNLVDTINSNANDFFMSKIIRY